MTPPWAHLDQLDHDTFRATIAFLENRLAEQGTIDWAIRLKPGQRIERMAINHSLAGPRAENLPEPWATAWRLIEESWSNPQLDGGSGTAVYGVQSRLSTGDRSGAVINTIVDLVIPHLEIKPVDEWRWKYIKKPRKPKKVSHVLSASLTSGDLVDVNVLSLNTLEDVTFLASLANALEAAVVRGLDIARRLGWDETRSLLGLGMLNRVYYTHGSIVGGQDSEVDAYHQGIAPSAKLLHAVVARIAAIQPSAAQSFASRWFSYGSTVFLRLWAALARDSELVPAEAVANVLQSLNDRKFWDLHVFPEISELRATRFNDFSAQVQNQLAARLRKGPPRSHWPKKADTDKVADARQYWAVRELRRIEIAGGVLPVRTKNWLDGRLPQFADLAQIAIDFDFPKGSTVRTVPANPDPKYDEMEGATRLRALETALLTTRVAWDNDPAARANDWINQLGNAGKLLADFEVTDNGAEDYPQVWNRFGWVHRPSQQEGDVGSAADQKDVASRVLVQLNQLSEETLATAVEGISAWMDSWERIIVDLPLTLPIWLRLWPLAVQATNRTPDAVDDADLSVVARNANEDREPMDLDTLNTPAGKLVGVFLAFCPGLTPDTAAFKDGSAERQMRDIVIAADGRSGLIAKHRLIEALPYFLRADSKWAQEHLIRPLLNDDRAALALWRAVARRTYFTEVLKIIGAAMAERANDRRLGRETRRRLVFSLVIESLHAFREGREPAVPNARVQQMLRTLDDEVRASAANSIQIFVRDLSAKPPPDQFSKKSDDIFRAAAAPFLRNVWPQERSLVTPGVSGALADLPATSGEAFAEAVETVARFLVPFECWSMVNYGLYGGEGEARKLAVINDEPKAQALLKLLDLTIGTAESAVIPHDITEALDQIRSVAPALIDSPIFRRLAATARR